MLKQVVEAIGQLPRYNKFLLQHIMALFQQIIAEEKGNLCVVFMPPARRIADSFPSPTVNLMGASNLAIVFGPTLMGCQSVESMVADFKAAQTVVEIMINNYRTLFTVRTTLTPLM
jgi:hypothetical protein